MGLVRRKAPGESAGRETSLLDRIITAMTTFDFDGETAYVLRDGDGARVVVLPSIGNNCIAFQTPVAGRPAYLLSTPASWVFATGICPLQPGETWRAWARLSAAPSQGE
jgi:hypothetical protein